MKKLGIISLIFLAFGHYVRGQENPITEFDLYGCWIFERTENREPPERIIYKSCENSNSELAIRSSEINFLAFNRCDFQEIIPSQLNCSGITETLHGTWTYDEKAKIVEIFYPEDYLNEFWEKVKEYDPQFYLPPPRSKKKFKIVGFKKGQLEIEKTTHNKGYIK